MTTPDTLASLIAKWRISERDLIDNACAMLTKEHADELEAALDALVEKWEEYASRGKPNGIYAQQSETFRACAAELRGRGARET